MQYKHLNTRTSPPLNATMSSINYHHKLFHSFLTRNTRTLFLGGLQNILPRKKKKKKKKRKIRILTITNCKKNLINLLNLIDNNKAML